MSRCTAFHHAMDKDWNFCGMSPASESYYSRYREAVRKLSGQKLDEDFIYEHFKEGAYRVILSIKNEDARTDALSYVSECLHNGENVTDRDLRGWFKVWVVENGQEPEKLTNVKPSTPNTDVEELTNVNSDTTAPPVLSLAQQQAAKQEPAFKTGNEIAQGLLYVPPAPKDPAVQTPVEKSEKELFMEACDDAYKHGKSDFRQEIDELIQYYPSWKNPGGVIYFCVTNPIEALAKRKQ